MSSWTFLTDQGVVGGFPWAEFARGKDTIIDIGGNRGTLCCSLALKYKDLPPLIVQDLPAQTKIAQAYIESKGLVGRVTFEPHDFFKPQKRVGRNLFILQRGGQTLTLLRF